MKSIPKVFFAGLTLAVWAATAAAQGFMRPPEIQGMWQPKVGAGGVYHMVNQNSKQSDMEIAIVDKEIVNGNVAYWMEVSLTEAKGPVYSKTLIAAGKDNDTLTLRMIIQTPGQKPMEFSMDMAKRTGEAPKNSQADFLSKIEKVGTETITVPAGTFSCDHYRRKDGSGDVWISDKVSPYGLVKSSGKDNTMTLTKLITDAKTHITETPVKFDPAEMMKRRQAPQE
jgi:hypothetical protein